MHPSNSMKVLNQSQKTWEKNDPGGTYQHHTNSINASHHHHNHHHHSVTANSNASRSHNSTPKAGQHSNVSVKTNWTELEITGNICNLSPSLWNFVHLTKLNLRNNNLTHLPPDVARLVNLTILDVTGNRLQSIPAELGDMVSLKELHLNNNCLKNLPYELGKLFQLQKLGLKGNPLPSKYLGFCNDASGTQKLISFLFDHLPARYSTIPERTWVRLSNCETPKPAVITVMCYNVLCDKNCSRQLYGYCPQWALNWDYRKKTIIGEIRRYQADILCLQEVETEHFHHFFQPELEGEGYSGIFSPKSRARTMQEAERKHVDGCAIFYKNAKFRALKDHLVEFNQVAIEAAEGSHDMINRVMTKDNIGLAVLLETTKAAWPNGPPPDSQHNQPLLVATCHVHWDPEYCDVKLIQTMMLVHKLQNIVKTAAVELRPDLSDSTQPDCNSIPLILCGDMNSLPESGVVEFLKSGRVDSNHRDFKEMGYKDCLRKLSYLDAKDNIYSHSFKLAQAYNKNIMPYTNYTYDFKGIIDYIFFSRDSMRCLGVLGPPDDSWFHDNRVHGCPHPQIPSDHLPLFAQLEMFRSPLIPYSLSPGSLSSSSLSLPNSTVSTTGFPHQQQQQQQLGQQLLLKNS